ncbi:auxin response factor 18 [Cicer arietinum]|uniref:Auxin response factor n=1 Tax=Cicer arietinum TaxID=3827 RepID=A0A1S2Y0V8_CICAR|nr:auxin response factor 18 [Cicer arietinum]XP_027189702.1 auxin response factor 18 [Cicer arietinum]
MNTLMDSRENNNSESVERYLDPQLWHACAGGMVQMPTINSKVYYFPQGHAEHACGHVNFRNCPKVPPLIPCKVVSIKYMADLESDEVYAKLKLVPLSGCGNDDAFDYENDSVVAGGISNGSDNQDKVLSFAKTLTQSDANNGGGFSVPRYCAETIFPRLDYAADPPLQNILAKDVHGETWKFRHIYRGTPRRHLLTTGWSTFVNHKKLLAGDSIVFLRAENGDLCVGIRRAKKGIGGGHEDPSGWNPAGENYPFPWFTQNENKMMRNINNNNSNGLNSSANMTGRTKVRPESVLEAVTLAANKQPFEVVYYPRASTPEFCVKAPLVEAAMQIRWCSGIRFKMAFETEDSSRISWFMGIVSAVQFVDPLLWPNSPWRLLQVKWDEPDLLQNVRRVNPWLVELVANIPSINLSPFSQPRKKLRLSQHPDFPLDGQISMPPTFPSNLLDPNNLFGRLPESTPAGMQGARHAHYGRPISDFHLSKVQSGLFSAGFLPFDHAATPHSVSNNLMLQKSSVSENVSCLLSMASSNQSSTKFNDEKKPQLVLFGQKILTEQQISLSTSGDTDTVSPVLTRNHLPDGNAEKMSNISQSYQWYKDNRRETEASLETDHCKVFMESEDVGRTIDLSSLGSYDELYRKLADMFGIEKHEKVNRVLYRDISGAVKHIGDEPFSNFTRTARRLTIRMDSSSHNGAK